MVKKTAKNTPSTRRSTPGTGQKRPGGWLLGLFALPFAAAGLGMLLLGVLPTLYDWSRMQFWQPVDATLLSARLNTSRSSKSTSYNVVARYRYQVGGREYVGDRVAISAQADNIGDFQTDLGEQLEQALQSTQPVRIWVDPAQPGDAVIDRSLRPGLLAFKLLFAMVFGGFGVGMLLYLVRGPSRAAARSTPSRASRAAAAGRLVRTPGGVHLYFPAGRWWGLKLAVGLVGAVFLAIGLWVPWEQDAGGDMAPWLFRLCFGGIGGAVLVGSFYALANSLQVQLDQDGLRTERRLLGLMLKWHQVPAREVVRLRVAESYSVETNGRREVYFRIDAELRGGKKIAIAQDLLGHKEADVMLQTIGSATGYPLG